MIDYVILYCARIVGYSRHLQSIEDLFWGTPFERHSSEIKPELQETVDARTSNNLLLELRIAEQETSHRRQIT